MKNPEGGLYAADDMTGFAEGKAPKGCIAFPINSAKLGREKAPCRESIRPSRMTRMRCSTFSNADYWLNTSEWECDMMSHPMLLLFGHDTVGAYSLPVSAMTLYTILHGFIQCA